VAFQRDYLSVFSVEGVGYRASNASGSGNQYRVRTANIVAFGDAAPGMAD
jgi:hypothetical protein